MVPIATKAKGETEEEKEIHINIEKLIECTLDNLEIPTRNSEGPFFYLIDHCFPIKG